MISLFMRPPRLFVVVLVMLLHAYAIRQRRPGDVLSPYSPYHQNLPDCESPDQKNTLFPQIKRKVKGLLCPMVRDEEGFLAEWVAYYEMQGFSMIIIYDDNSTQSFAELAPWISTGFIKIEHEWWKNFTFTNSSIPADSYTITYDELYEGKAFGASVKPTDMRNGLASMHCKRTALQLGYDLYVV